MNVISYKLREKVGKNVYLWLNGGEFFSGKLVYVDQIVEIESNNMGSNMPVMIDSRSIIAFSIVGEDIV